MGSKSEVDLKFPVEKIPVEGLSGRRIIDPSWFALPPEADDPIHPVRLVQPVRVDFRLERLGDDVRVRMGLVAAVSLACARCLEPFVFPIEAQTRFTFCKASGTPPQRGEMELSMEDLESGSYEGGEIDLSDLVYEQIVLSLPIKPLCRVECRGFCPKCGANLNLESCGCAERADDPRWDALKKIQVRR